MQIAGDKRHMKAVKPLNGWDNLIKSFLIAKPEERDIFFFESARWAVIPRYGPHTSSISSIWELDGNATQASPQSYWLGNSGHGFQPLVF